MNDPVTRADAIVVLGGGLEYRPFAAARPYTNGCAKVILIAQPELSPTEAMALRPPEYATARQTLVRPGVPESSIEPLGTNVTSTRDEACALRDWVRQHNAKSVLIPTDIFHTRRARWIFQKALNSPDFSMSAFHRAPSSSSP